MQKKLGKKRTVSAVVVTGNGNGAIGTVNICIRCFSSQLLLLVCLFNLKYNSQSTLFLKVGQ